MTDLWLLIAADYNKTAAAIKLAQKCKGTMKILLCCFAFIDFWLSP